jgi:hypothetical protein
MCRACGIRHVQEHGLCRRCARAYGEPRELPPEPRHVEPPTHEPRTVVINGVEYEIVGP